MNTIRSWTLLSLLATSLVLSGQEEPFLEDDFDTEYLEEGDAFADQLLVRPHREKARFVANLQGIVLTPEPRRCLDVESTRGIIIDHLNVPGDVSHLTTALEKLLNQPFNSETFCAVRSEVYRHYRKADHPFVLVEVGRTSRHNGLVHIIVRESKLGKVAVVDNNHSSASRYKNYFQQKAGEPISQKKLNQDVDFMNRNPYRYVNVIYSPGERELTTDLTLKVADRRPFFFFTGVDNTGVPSTGRERVFAGLSCNQMFGLDHVFFYQYSTNYHARKYHSNSFQYTALFPWKDLLNLYGGWSVVHTNFAEESIKNTGHSMQGSLRYTSPFSPGTLFSQEWVVGFDLKNTNNTAEFTDATPIIGRTINLTQWMFGYKCKYEWQKVNVEASLEGFFSPFEWLPNQSEEDFDTLRPNSSNKWFYALASCYLRYALPHSFCMQLKTVVEGSFNTLPPSEQLGMGGYATVRGYDERQYNADNGAIVNLELQSPHFSPIRTKNLSFRSDAYFLLFVDGGVGFDNTPIPMVHHWDYLAGAGAGFRCAIGSYFNARVDYGQKLHQQDGFTGGSGEIHFSVSGSF